MPSRTRRLEWHEAAILEMAESLAWYAEHSPRTPHRMRKEIEKAALSLIQSPLAVPGRLGAVAGTHERVVGHDTPYTLIFVRNTVSGDCTIYRCVHHRRRYPEE